MSGEVRTPGAGPDQPDDRDLDEGGLELTPRPAPVPGARRGRRRWMPLVVLGLLAVIVGVVVVQARGATVFYKNADEAVRERSQLGDKRFRLQGVVVGKPDLSEGDDDPTRFTVSYHGVQVKVVHTGAEPALFKEGLPVVCEGRWNPSGTAFDSNRILVKHTEDYKKKDADGEYEKEHPGRVDQSEKSTP